MAVQAVAEAFLVVFSGDEGLWLRIVTVLPPAHLRRAALVAGGIAPEEL